jgi:hypothetical protein
MNPGDLPRTYSRITPQLIKRECLSSGHPNRQTVIGKDDCIDLAIALHKCETVEQFIERMW